MFQLILMFFFKKKNFFPVISSIAAGGALVGAFESGARRLKGASSCQGRARRLLFAVSLFPIRLLIRTLSDFYSFANINFQVGSFTL